MSELDLIWAPRRAASLRFTASLLAVSLVASLSADEVASPVDAIAGFGEAPVAPAGPVTTPQRGGIRPQSVTGGFTVDTSSREASRVFYNTVYRASEGFAPEWTGSLTTGVPGVCSTAFNEAVIRRVNFFRAMAGIPAAVELDAVYSAKAQQAALMMSANQQLNHFPPSTWTFYTADGAEAAARSNLALGYTGPAAIDGLMFDTGGNNTPVGHRRWFLYPQTRKMGTGNIPSTPPYPATDATWVLDDNYGQLRPATRDGFVSWPPPGFVPHSLVPARWSLSYPGGNFTDATVTVTRDGVSIPVQIESRQNGFGENTLVWIPGNLDPNSGPATPFPAPVTDSTNMVVVGPVFVGGVPKTFTYSVILFDPSRPGSDTVSPTLVGSDSPVVGQGSDYSFNAIPGADGYRWRQSTLTSYTQIEGAEDAVPSVQFVTSAGYSPILSGTAASGKNSFHLAHATPDSQQLSLPAQLLIGSTSELRFSKFLGLASPGQTAKAQITIDDGANWQTVWSQIGTVTGSAAIPKVVFEPAVVSLSAFSGKIVRFRFVYDYQLGNTYFPQTAAGFGFYIDNIAITGAQQLQGSVTAMVNASPLRFVPPAAGTYLLQAQPRYYGEFFGDFGASKLVQAGAAGLAFSGIRSEAGGTLTLDFTGPLPGTGSYVLERSTGPTGPWTTATGSATAVGSGAFRFTGVATGASAGFFRVRTP